MELQILKNRIEKRNKLIFTLTCSVNITAKELQLIKKCKRAYNYPLITKSSNYDGDQWTDETILKFKELIKGKRISSNDHKSILNWEEQVTKKFKEFQNYIKDIF